MLNKGTTNHETIHNAMNNFIGSRFSGEMCY